MKKTLPALAPLAAPEALVAAEVLPVNVNETPLSQRSIQTADLVALEATDYSALIRSRISQTVTILPVRMTSGRVFFYHASAPLQETLSSRSDSQSLLAQAEESAVTLLYVLPLTACTLLLWHALRTLLRVL